MATLFAAESGPAEVPIFPVEDVASRSGDAGLALRDAREAGGYTLRDIAATTRIPERYLAAIEASDFAALQAPVYAIGFAKSFARSVGVPEDWVATAVRRRIAADRPDPPEAGPAPAPPPSLRRRR